MTGYRGIRVPYPSARSPGGPQRNRRASSKQAWRTHAGERARTYTHTHTHAHRHQSHLQERERREAGVMTLVQRDRGSEHNRKVFRELCPIGYTSTHTAASSISSVSILLLLVLSQNTEHYQCLCFCVLVLCCCSLCFVPPVAVPCVISVYALSVLICCCSLCFFSLYVLCVLLLCCSSVVKVFGMRANGAINWCTE